MQVARDDEAADVLRQVARKAHQLARQRDETDEHRVVGLEPASRIRSASTSRPSHQANMPARRSTCARSRPSALADVAHGALRPVGDERRGERRAVAAVFCVDVLHHLLAPLVLEVDVDVGRLVASPSR